MDKLVKTEIELSEDAIDQFILSQIPDFHQCQWDDERKRTIYQQAKSHLSNKRYNALTFEMYQLQGTPSSILIDKKSVLRRVSFGAVNQIENQVQKLLDE